VILRDGKNNIIGTSSIGEDITEKRKAEAALQESEMRFRIISEQTGQLIYDWDIRTGNIFWAGAIKNVSGFEPSEFQKVDINRWSDMIHPDDRDSTTVLLDKAMEDNMPFRAEYRFRKKDKSYIFIEDTGIYLKDDAGKSVRMLGIMKDITSRKEMADIERSRTEELKKFNDLMVGREVRMVELKKEIEDLKEKIAVYGKRS
jgi:PAS domain S-box-containing protein